VSDLGIGISAQEILESIGDAFYFLDREWRFVYMNRQAEPLVGKSVEECLGRGVWELFPEAVGTPFYAEYHRAMDENVEVRLTEYYHPLRTWFTVSAYPAPKGLAVYFRDVTLQIESERSLREKEALLASIVETVAEGVVAFDVAGRVLAANPAFLAILGFDEGADPYDALGDFAAEFKVWDADGRPLPLEEWPVARALRGERVEQEDLRFSRRGAEPRWVSLSAAPILDADGSVRAAVVSAVDVTERTSALNRLRQSESRLLALMDSARDFAIVGLDQDLTIAELNEGGERILGCAAEDVVGQPVDVIFTDDDVAAGRPRTEAEIARRDGRSVDERWHVRPDGGLFWASGYTYSVHGEVGDVRYVKVFQDRTAQRLAEEAVLRSEREFRALFESAPGSYLVLRPDFTIVTASDEMVRTAGRTREDLVGRHLFDVFPDNPDDPEVAASRDLRDSIETVLATRQTHTMPLQRYDVQRPDGEWEERWWSPVNSPVLGDGGEVLFVIHRTEEVTEFVRERKAQGDWSGETLANPMTRMETELYLRARDIQDANRRLHEAMDALRRSEAELERRVAERTAELEASHRLQESYNYSVSHDLRAPLRAIVATARILQDEHGAALSPDAHALLERQASAAKRLGDLVDELLKSSRLTRQEMRPAAMDLSALAEEVAREQGQALGKEFDLRVQPGMVAVADPLLVRLVLENVVGNAMKYSAEGTTIQVGRVETPRGSACFVSDRGIGFDMAYEARIWRPFERLVLDKDFEGTGIGLYNVAHMVERMGGQVWAESEPGRGSTFYFTLGRS